MLLWTLNGWSIDLRPAPWHHLQCFHRLLRLRLQHTHLSLSGYNAPASFFCVWSSISRKCLEMVFETRGEEEILLVVQAIICIRLFSISKLTTCISLFTSVQHNRTMLPEATDAAWSHHHPHFSLLPRTPDPPSFAFSLSLSHRITGVNWELKIWYALFSQIHIWDRRGLPKISSRLQEIKTSYETNINKQLSEVHTNNNISVWFHFA